MSPTLITFLCLFGSMTVVLACYASQTKLETIKENRIQLAASLALAALMGVIGWLAGSITLFRTDFLAMTSSDRRIWLDGLLLAPGVYYLVFLGIAAICQMLAGRYFDKPAVQESFALSFYKRQKNGSNERWVLYRSKVPYRSFTRIMSVICLAAALLLMAGIYYDGLQETPAWYGFPILLLVFCRTFALYLGGPLADEKDDVVDQKALEGEMQHRYALAARHLKEQFEDALLYMKLPDDLPEEKSSFKTLHALEKSPNVNDRLAAASLRSRYGQENLDPDYIQVASCLLDKQNVMVFNPFYQDLGRYLALPLGESLMSRRKILVLCEGNERAQAVCEWMAKILDQNGSFHEKWKVRVLDDLVPDCEAGILSYSRLYDPDVFAKNQAFFAQAEYVLLLEPSQVLSTMQVPLGILSDLVREGFVKPVFCVLDQNRNGLKDTLSHVLKETFDAEFVLADPAPAQTLMIWDANADFQAIERFQKETLFLAGGVELAAEAVAVQIPEVDWVAQDSVPLLDIQNNAIKSYGAISRRMNIEPGQQALRKRLNVQTSLWSLPDKMAEFLIVEDEFHNPFAAARNYTSRGTKEVFINVMAEDYLLRDYFCANPEMFLTNPNTIRSLVPDYVKSRRNLLLRLIMKMNFGALSEDELSKELRLGGLETNQPKELLFQLLERYTFAKPDLFVLEVENVQSVCTQPKTITKISIHPDKFDEYFGKTLKNASYILEDETYDRHLLNSRPYSLIPQRLLPGQFLTFEGKNYRVKHISPSNGVILRRASDLADGRKAYRQLRYYHLPDFETVQPQEFERIGAFEFTKMEADFSVDTYGYVETSSRDGAQREEEHIFSTSHVPALLKRDYSSKQLLKIRFPQMPQDQLFQVAELLQELLPTVLPDGAAYLAILARKPDHVVFDGKERAYGSSLMEEQTLVVVEDSDFDLGLLDTFQKYFWQFMEIIQDYLRWMQETLDSSSSSSDSAQAFTTDPLDFDPDQMDLQEMASIERTPRSPESSTDSSAINPVTSPEDARPDSVGQNMADEKMVDAGSKEQPEKPEQK